MNAVEIEEAVSELASQPFDAAEFPFLFLEAYGNKSTTIKRLRDGHANKSKLAGAVLQRNNIHIATCAHIPPPKVKQNLYLRGAGARKKCTQTLNQHLADKPNQLSSGNHG